jgi:hypothetical protein
MLLRSLLPLALNPYTDTPHTDILLLLLLCCCIAAAAAAAAAAQAPLLVEQGLLRSMEHALWRDTSFLAGLGVMDYSLLVGECAGAGCRVLLTRLWCLRH